MTKRNTIIAVAFCLVASLCFASDANVGTWKLNETKSKIAKGSAKNTKVVYTMEGSKLKCVVDGVDGDGKATHNEWTGSFDGKDYAVTGDPNADTRAIKKLNDWKYEINNKKGGKVVTNGTITISKDGKTRTLWTTGTDAKGKKMENTFVYDKQ